MTTNVRLVAVQAQELNDPDGDPGYVFEDAENNPQDRFAQERANAYVNGDWHWVGIRAMATLEVDSGADPAHNVNWKTEQHVYSSGLWGIESDSSGDYFDEVGREQVAELREIVQAMGVEWDESVVPDHLKEVSA